MSIQSALSANKDRLDAVFGRVESLPKDNLQLQSDFARYLCVLVAGFVETEISDLAMEHCRKQSSPTVTNYVESYLSRVGVLNGNRLLQLVGRFDSKWHQELEQFIMGERKDALDSIVANRNQIAHGQTVGITYARVQKYYESICQIVDFLREKFT